MAGLINLRLLTDFFNKIGHEQTFSSVLPPALNPWRLLASTRFTA